MEPGWAAAGYLEAPDREMPLSSGDGGKEVNLGLVVLDLMEQPLPGGLFSDNRRQAGFELTVLQDVFRRARDFFLQVLYYLPKILAWDLYINPASGLFAQRLRYEYTGHMELSF